jgi:tRNA-dihydrouridine synthase A
MLGRAAYHDPWVLADPGKTRAGIAQQMFQYCVENVEKRKAASLRSIVRHMLGLYHGCPGARLWRRTLSDARLLAANDPGLLLHALEQVEGYDDASNRRAPCPPTSNPSNPPRSVTA